MHRISDPASDPAGSPAGNPAAGYPAIRQRAPDHVPDQEVLEYMNFSLKFIFLNICLKCSNLFHQIFNEFNLKNEKLDSQTVM